MLGKVILGEDRRQQEWANRAPSLVDIDLRRPPSAIVQ